MAKQISADRKNVRDFLESGKDHLFVIPEYQRPYAWGSDEIQTLFDDLVEFMAGNFDGVNYNEKTEYFLGTVVSYENENGEQEIIDGQQRITSLFLLLRAVYAHIDRVDSKGKQETYMMDKIKPTLWKLDRTTGEINPDSILIVSRVMDEEGNAVLHNILKTGIADPNAKDNYSKNYLLFQKLLNELAIEKTLSFYDFISAILDQAILLPITADTQDTALTIFSTLNDRGMQLSDADIFKAKIYNHLDEAGKQDFIKSWKELDKESQDAGESIQKLFYYYMFYLRALEGDNKTTTPGLRKYYSANKFRYLYIPDIMDKLKESLILWKIVNKHEEIDDEKWSKDTGIIQSLDILKDYNNEFWKYPVEIYYLTYHKTENFVEYFGMFLHQLIRVLLCVYILSPTLNAVKTDIIRLNIETLKNPLPPFKFKEITDEDLMDRIKVPNKNVIRMLLKIYAYNYQDTLLPSSWEIEHILPQKWQPSYFTDTPSEKISELIEHIGNKVPFEKKLNIIASNGYFEKKKQEYAKSSIIVTKKLSEYHKQDWREEQIHEHDVEKSKEIISILNEWNRNYCDYGVQSSIRPTKEELEVIKKAKENGWI